MELSVPHGSDLRPGDSCRHAFRSTLLAARRADDDVRSAAHNLLWIGDEAALGKAARGSFCEYIGAAGAVA
jgi:hypothetical protein